MNKLIVNNDGYKSLRGYLSFLFCGHKFIMSKQLVMASQTNSGQIQLNFSGAGWKSFTKDIKSI